MKKPLLWTVLICIGFMFAGCPYYATVSIDTPNAVKIDTKLLGKWQARTSDDDTYIITKKDDYTYDILDKEKTPTEGSEPKKYCVFLSTVNGSTFLNLYENKDGSDKTYYFYKLEVSTETEGFTLFPLTEYITETFSSNAELKKFIQTNMGLSFFYGNKQEYIKVGK
jgi:hypothetical protein